VLHNSVQVKDVAELIALSKQKQITLGTSGEGSASHLTLARFNAQTGANLVHVPYRGGGALIPDVLAGTVSGAMTEVSTLLEHHNQGKVREAAGIEQK
jgi:tripartite-type tricarboxylate transporter receptor subunit TctC